MTTGIGEVNQNGGYARGSIQRLPTASKGPPVGTGRAPGTFIKGNQQLLGCYSDQRNFSDRCRGSSEWQMPCRGL
jgi:hypothetical protein